MKNLKTPEEKTRHFKQNAKQDKLLQSGESLVRVSFILSREERRLLKQYANDHDMTVTAVIRRRLSSIIE